ncbi:MAG: hemolysin III family protein [Bacteroidota bacterium]
MKNKCVPLEEKFFEMKLLKTDKKQSVVEEKWNYLTHATGAVLAIFAIVLMLLKSNSAKEYWSSIIYGFSLLFTMLASAMYHFEKRVEIKSKLRILDHSGIFLLIAGTYTPLAILVLGSDNLFLLIIEWSIAIIGVILKIFFTGRYQKTSLLIYLGMGWIIVFDINKLIDLLPFEGLMYIVYGGLAYTVGTIFYAVKKLKFSHVIWHFFVLVGAMCHFLFVYYYAL